MMLRLRTNVRNRIGLREMLTVNAPYPCCQAKFRTCLSFIQCDDPPLTNCIAFAKGMFAHNDNNT